MSVNADVLTRLGIALLCGLAVGAEREWSGHARGRHGRLGGIRTLGLLGLVAGLSGWFWTQGLAGLSAILLGGAAALVVAAYVVQSRRDIEGTTDVAALVVMAAGVLAGAGFDTLASGIIAITLLLLVEKKWLHRLVAKIGETEMQAAARFAVMATVILPILPQGPYGPLGGVRPRQLWMLVLFFSGLSFLGYFARRSFGRDRGYAIAGALGGVLSSTSATYTLSHLSRTKTTAGRALAAGALGASVVLFPRVLIAAGVLSPRLASALWPAFVLPAVIGILLFLRGLKAHERPGQTKEQNPLQVKVALQMAVIFQVVFFGVAYAKEHFGQQGLVGSALLLGLFDVDALTISMARLTEAGTAAEVAARSVTVGVLSNTIVKLIIALTVGRGAYRGLAGVGLTLMAVALGAAVYWR